MWAASVVVRTGTGLQPEVIAETVATPRKSHQRSRYMMYIKSAPAPTACWITATFSPARAYEAAVRCRTRGAGAARLPMNVRRRHHHAELRRCSCGGDLTSEDGRTTPCTCATTAPPEGTNCRDRGVATHSCRRGDYAIACGWPAASRARHDASDVLRGCAIRRASRRPARAEPMSSISFPAADQATGRLETVEESATSCSVGADGALVRCRRARIELPPLLHPRARLRRQERAANRIFKRSGRESAGIPIPSRAMEQLRPAFRRASRSSRSTTPRSSSATRSSRW